MTRPIQSMSFQLSRWYVKQYILEAKFLLQAPRVHDGDHNPMNSALSFYNRGSICRGKNAKRQVRNETCLISPHNIVGIKLRKIGCLSIQLAGCDQIKFRNHFKEKLK